MTEVRAWKHFRDSFPPDVQERVDGIAQDGITIADVQCLASAMLLDCVALGKHPQKEQACLRVLETTAKWLGEQVGGEADRMVQVPEGLTKRLQLLQGGEKDNGDDLLA